MPAQARFPVAAFKVFLSPSFCKKHFTGGGFFAPFFRGKAFMRCIFLLRRELVQCLRRYRKMKRWNMIFTGKAAKKENRRNNQVYESLFWASAHPGAVRQ